MFKRKFYTIVASNIVTSLPWRIFRMLHIKFHKAKQTLLCRIHNIEKVVLLIVRKTQLKLTQLEYYFLLCYLTTNNKTVDKIKIKPKWLNW